MSRKSEPDTLTVDRKELAEALRSLKPIVKTANNSILRSVLLRAGSRPDAPCLTISATNRETSLSVEIARQGGADDFAVLVGLDRLAGFAAADWGESVELSLGKGRLEAAGRTVARIVIEDLDNFPILPQPPEGPGVELPHAVVEEIVAAWPFVNRDQKVRGGWQKVVHVFEREGGVDVFAGGRHRAWWRQGLENAGAPAGFAVGLTPETATLLAALAGKTGVAVRTGERQDFFSGPNYLLAQTRPESEVVPLAWLTDAAMQPESWEALPQLVNVLPVVEAVAQEAGERSPLLVTEGEKGTALVSVKSDLVDAEGMIPGRFPIYKTGYPNDLLALLRELDRVAGTEREIEVGRFGQGHLRFRVAGVAEGLVSGMQ